MYMPLEYQHLLWRILWRTRMQDRGLPISEDPRANAWGLRRGMGSRQGQSCQVACHMDSYICMIVSNIQTN